MPQKRRIAIFSGYFDPHSGGVESYVDGLSRQLEKRGNQIVIITSNTENAGYHEFRNDIEIIRLPVFPFFKQRYPLPNPLSPGFWKSIHRILYLKPEIFILNTRFYPTTIIGLFLAKKFNERCRIIEHGTGHLPTSNPITNLIASIYEHFLTRLVRLFNPRFFGVSAACNKWLEHFDIKAEGIIYNGVDTNRSLSVDPQVMGTFGIDPDGIVFSFVSRMIREKGVMELMEAFEKLVATGIPAHLLMVGDGSLYPYLATTYCNHPFIHILGKKTHTEVLELLVSTDVVVIPSKYPEGLSTLILEAGLTNCSVIATPMGGTEEVITDPEYGLIVKSGSVADLVQAMTTVFHDKARRTTMAANLHDRVMNRFSWKVIIDELYASNFFTR